MIFESLDNPGWLLMKRRVLYQAKNDDEITLLGDDVTAPSGHQFTYIHVDCPYDVVFVVAIDDTMSVLIVQQYRYTVKEEVVEVPAGSPQGEESLQEGAMRELEEEGGLIASQMQKIGEFYSSVGITNQRCHVYLATGLKSTKKKLDAGESLRTVWVPMDEAIAAVREGRVKNVGAAYGLFLAYEVLVRGRDSR
jgi:8-oxo-dGTP pyrophosphatase MutT (NUDIX family)